MCSAATSKSPLQGESRRKSSPGQPVMRLLHAVLVVIASLSSVLAAVDSKQVQVATLPRQETNSSNSSLNGVKSAETEPPSASVSASVEERGIVSSTTKLLESKKIPKPIVNLLTGNKHAKSQKKLRALLLQSLPLDKAAELIFLKMPSKVPKPLPTKLPNGIKGFDFKIPGVSNAIIRLKMEVWFYYRYPPTYAFKQLGLVGKGSGAVLRKHENYKYFKAYFDAWYESQKHLIF